MLRGAIGMMAVSLALVAGLVIVSGSFRDRWEAEYAAQNQRFLQGSRNYLSVDQDEAIIKGQYPRFVDLFRRGIVGREQRLDWVETLKRSAAAIRLPSMRFEISSRQPYTPDYALAPGPYEVHASTMKLDLGLLHEGDLAVLLRDLERAAPGFFSVRDCTLKRTRETVERDVRGANVHAECNLVWLTITLANGQEISL